MRIVVIADEPGIASLLQRCLSEEGHVVRLVTTVHGARYALREDKPELLIVDRMLPDGDGLELVRSLRQAGDTRPPIVLTARDRVDERVEGLYGGADDYVTKPFVCFRRACPHVDDHDVSRIAIVLDQAGSLVSASV